MHLFFGGIMPDKCFRRMERELALQVLYTLDVQGKLKKGDINISQVVPDLQAQVGTMSFTYQLVEGVAAELSEIDSTIQKKTHHWTINRMLIVDRNILRIGTYEILRMQEIPVRVTINECVEIAKEFSDKGSHCFINGVLDAISKSVPNTKVDLPLKHQKTAI